MSDFSTVPSASPDRPTCAVHGCNNLVRIIRRPGGREARYLLCNTHVTENGRGSLNYLNTGARRKLLYEISPDGSCESCGWDKARCDLHRHDPKLGYSVENCMVLCPNCHRMVTEAKRQRERNEKASRMIPPADSAESGG